MKRIKKRTNLGYGTHYLGDEKCRRAIKLF
jgi:hypothetical protein